MMLILHGKQILSSAYDDDMVQLLHRELLNNGIEILLETEVKSIGKGCVSLSGKNGESVLSADAVILAAGTVPNSELAAAAGLDLATDGAIRTDSAYRTSDPDIYAVGDVIEVYNPLSAGSGRIALAGPAQMAARAAADGICGLESRTDGFIGSSCIKVFGLNAASTGLTEKKAVRCGYSCDSVLAFPSDKVGIMPGSSYLAVKLIFEKPSGRILGAQAIGKGDAVGRVNAIASMLKLGATLEDLKNAELCYSPVYGTAKDAVNMAALVGLNVLNGVFRQVHVSEVRGLVESGAVIIDVREPREYAAGHVKGALNIPLGEIRSRAGEIPRDVPVYLHCRSSQRSYYAICCLQGLGFTNVVNISGSFLGISLYEYFDDVMLSREPIVTAYNFN